MDVQGRVARSIKEVVHTLDTLTALLDKVHRPSGQKGCTEVTRGLGALTNDVRLQIQSEFD